MNLYGAIWAKCPNVAYLEGRLKSNKYGTYQTTNSEHNEVINVAPIVMEDPSTQEPLYTTINESTGDVTLDYMFSFFPSEVVTYQATNSEHNEDINVAPIIMEDPSTQEPLYTTIEESTDSNSDISLNYMYSFFPSEVVTYQATNGEHNEDINTAPIISTNTEVPSTQESTIEESTDSNNDLTQSKAYRDIITTDDDYNVNEGMGGINEVTMKPNETYGTTKQLQMAQLTYDNIANPSSNPLTILNPTDDDFTNTKYSVMATDANRLSGIAEVVMMRNEAYGVRQSIDMSVPPCTDLKNEAYTR